MTRGDPDLNQAVQGFLAQMWQHIDATIRAALHPHHWEHEPGGKDQVRIPVFFLADVVAEDPDNNDTLIYSTADKLWYTGPGGGASVHQVHFTLPLPAMIVPPGPCNITGNPLTISAVLITTDDTTVAGSLNVGGNSYSFSTGGGGLDVSGLTDTWGERATMTLSLSDYGSDGTYLSIDVAAG